MNSRKRIAVLVGQAEESYQEQFISGFLTQAFKYDCDVCVFAVLVFSVYNSKRSDSVFV